MPQCSVIYYAAGKLTVEITAGTQIDFQAHKFSLTWLRNGQTGTLVIPTLAVYY
jgi:hypothetical protein